VTYVYDGDGNRVAKTVGGVTTKYLVDTNNPTGYAQVVDELHAGSVVKSYTYGHDLISQRIIGSGLSFYGYDGHGSVRLLTDATATVTDTYDYDAFGNLISRTGTTSNDYLYSGEQFDANLGFYYLRARYLAPLRGRFISFDGVEGTIRDPGTLHKYVFVNDSPLNNSDPSGQIGVADSIGEINVLTWRVTLCVMDFPRAIATGRLVLAALNLAAFLGDNESRDLFITGAGGPFSAAEIFADSASVIFSSTKDVLSAGFAVGGGLSRSAVISEESANQLLQKKTALSFEQSDSYVASFDGPVTASIAEPGRQWFRYTDVPVSKGTFLTERLFGTPEEAIDGLYLRPWGNRALYRQTVTATGRSIVLEGAIKGSPSPGVRQTVIVDREKFEFGIGQQY